MNRTTTIILTLLTTIFMFTGCNLPNITTPETPTESRGNGGDNTNTPGYTLPTTKGWVEYSHEEYVNTPFATAERGNKRFLFQVTNAGLERVLVVSKPKGSDKGWKALNTIYLLGADKSPLHYWVDTNLRPSVIYKDASKGNKQFIVRLKSDNSSWEEVAPSAQGYSNLMVDKLGGIYDYQYDKTNNQYLFKKLSADESSWVEYGKPISRSMLALYPGSKPAFAFDNEGVLHYTTLEGPSTFTVFKYDFAAAKYTVLTTFYDGPGAELLTLKFDAQNRACAVVSFVFAMPAPGEDIFDCNITLYRFDSSGNELGNVAITKTKRSEYPESIELAFSQDDLYLKAQTRDQSTADYALYLYRLDSTAKGWDKAMMTGLPVVNENITTKAAVDSTGRVYLRTYDKVTEKVTYYTFNK